MGVAITATGGPEPDEGDGASDGFDAYVFGTRRLLAANFAYVTSADADRLHRGIMGERRTLEDSLKQEVDELPEVVLWNALGVPVPPRPDHFPEARFVFDPRDPRPLILARLSMLEEAASELTRALLTRAEDVDWDGLTIFVALPIVARRGAIGESLLRISGGLTLPPIIAVLAQTHADASLD